MLSNLLRTLAFYVLLATRPEVLSCSCLGVPGSAATKLPVFFFLLPLVREVSTCLSVSALSVCSSDHPTSCQVESLRAPPHLCGRAAAGGCGAGACVAVIVCSCLCSRGRRSYYQQVLSGCQESHLAQFSWQPARPLPPLSAAGWSAAITGPLRLNTGT